MKPLKQWGVVEWGLVAVLAIVLVSAYKVAQAYGYIARDDDDAPGVADPVGYADAIVRGAGQRIGRTLTAHQESNEIVIDGEPCNLIVLDSVIEARGMSDALTRNRFAAVRCSATSARLTAPW